MYTALFNALGTTPAPYESTGEAFWDDEYISASMLKAHLEPHADGASRTHAFIARSSQWIGEYLGKKGEENPALLDLGCGPGLYAEQFAQQGYGVTGVDISYRSLAYAQQRAQAAHLPIIYMQADYCSLDFVNLYDAAILIYCDFGVLDPQTRFLLLQKVFSALKPGGMFVVDVFTPPHYEAFQNTLTLKYEQEGFWCGEPYICIQRNKAYPGQTYLEQYTIVTESDLKTYNLWNQAFLPAQLRTELQSAGFMDVDLYEDAAGTPLWEGSATCCAIGWKRDGGRRKG